MLIENAIRRGKTMNSKEALTLAIRSTGTHVHPALFNAKLLLRLLVCASVVSTLLFAIAIGGVSVPFGSLANAIAYARGNYCMWQQGEVDIGVISPGKSAMAVAVIVNLTREPLTIIGGQADCGCISSETFPIVLKPQEERKLSFNINYAGRGDFVHFVRIYDQTSASHILLLRGRGA